ncbi:hypothetical protein B0O99DRAFT_596901 [Bisporella sp. PMI_857]|nr:hypothetical protein B0O99DRAFT_596901 [Bisporella sp. PMI_857]
MAVYSGFYPLLGIAAPGSLFLAFAGYLCIVVLQHFNIVRKPKREPLDFSNITAVHDFDITKTPPYPYRPWRVGKFHMTMGIRKMPEDDWLSLDNLYVEEQTFRNKLIRERKDAVYQCLPASNEAIEETLEYIVKYLTKRYPTYFFHPKGNPHFIQNSLTGKTFKISVPFEQHPLEVAAQLVMEDINILMEGSGSDTDYYLMASFSMGPAGWDIQERIGFPLRRIHYPVPMWQQKLRKPMDKFFTNLAVSGPVQRNSYFMQVDDTMFQQMPFPSDFSQLSSPPRVEDIRIRHERQTLRRLPRSNAILFMVRTYLLPVVALVKERDNLYAFHQAVNAMPPEMAKYKAKHLWEDVFEEWYAEVMDGYVPESEREDSGS